jgi:hypothetical protein
MSRRDGSLPTLRVRRLGRGAPALLVVLLMACSASAGTAAPPSAVGGGRLPTTSPSPSRDVGSGPPRTTGDPTEHAIPPVVDAVKAARRGAAIPSPLIPPIEKIHYDQFPPVPNCWELRNEPHHLAKCTLFAGGDAGTIVLIGDSHALQWMTPIAWIAKRDGWTVIPLWHLGCYPTTYDAGRECETYFRWAERQVRILHPDVVLISGALRYKTPNAVRLSASGTAKVVAAVVPNATHVAVIGDPPDLRFLPYVCLGKEGATLRTCTARLTDAQIKVYLAAERAAKENGGAFLNTIGWFCYQDECPAVIGHTVSYRVSDHITMHCGLRVRPQFRRAFLHVVSP